MAYDFFGIPVSELNVWLIWILPFAAALIIPAVGKFSKLTTGRVAIAFGAMSAISAATLLPMALAAHEIHHQIMWIDTIGIKAGVLGDPLSIICLLYTSDAADE